MSSPAPDPGLDLPPEPGTYLVALVSSVPLSLEIGRRGTLRAPAGVYLYVGSALGPGGLQGRLGRHLRGSDARRWHVDHLRAVTQPVAAWWRCGRRRREHAWARVILGLRGAEVPLPRFGASDCRCRSHLVWVPRLPDPELGPPDEIGRWSI